MSSPALFDQVVSWFYFFNKSIKQLMYAGLILVVQICTGLLLGLSVVNAADDPVVLQVGEIVLTRNEFEQQFGMAMVISAIRAGAPIKSGVQIRDLRERYLQHRATELLLLGQAGQYGIEITEAELQTEAVDFMQQLREQYGDDRLSGFDDKTRLNTYLREQLLIAKLKQKLLDQADIPADDAKTQNSYIENLVEQFGKQTEVHTYMDQLR
jgi:hypothetical protein